MIDTVSGAYVEVALFATGAISNSMIAKLEDAEVSVAAVTAVAVKKKRKKNIPLSLLRPASICPFCFVQLSNVFCFLCR